MNFTTLWWAVGGCVNICYMFASLACTWLQYNQLCAAPTVRMLGRKAGKMCSLGCTVVHTQTHTHKGVGYRVFLNCHQCIITTTNKQERPWVTLGFHLATNGEHIQRTMTGAWTVVNQTDKPVTVDTKKPFRHHKDPGAHTRAHTHTEGFIVFASKTPRSTHTNKHTHTHIHTELRIHYLDFIQSLQGHIIPHKHAGRWAKTHTAGTCLSNHLPTSNSAMEAYGG